MLSTLNRLCLYKERTTNAVLKIVQLMNSFLSFECPRCQYTTSIASKPQLHFSQVLFKRHLAFANSQDRLSLGIFQGIHVISRHDMRTSSKSRYLFWAHEKKKNTQKHSKSINSWSTVYVPWIKTPKSSTEVHAKTKLKQRGRPPAISVVRGTTTVSSSRLLSCQVDTKKRERGWSVGGRFL